MTQFRRMELWVFLALAGLLLALSLGGSFLGVPRASALFNSWPLVIFWFLFAFLLIAGLWTFEQLRQRPGSLMMHVAALLILGGAMWGSTRGHEVANNLLGEKKVPSGYLQISEGETNNLISSDTGHVLGHLPFSLALEKFQIEEYPAPQKDWLLVLEVPQSPSHMMADESPIQQVVVPWQVGQEVTVPEKRDLRIKVLQYLPAAKPVYDQEAQATLTIVGSGQAPTVLPAKVGQKTALTAPKVEIEILQVHANLTVPGMKVDLGPTLEVQLSWPDGKKETRHVMSQFPAHGQKDDGLRLSYDFPGPVAAEADPKSTTPAMEVLLTCGNKQQRQWFVPNAGSEESPWIDLGPLLEKKSLEKQSLVLSPQSSATATATTATATTAAIPGMAHPPIPADIALVKPQGEKKAYISTVAVTDHVVAGGEPVSEKDFVAKKKFRVNDPMHYGGYHFYQYNYGHDPGTGTAFTVLSVTSDSGLLAVFAGFFLLMAGTVWHCWFRPAWAYFAGRRNDGD